MIDMKAEVVVIPVTDVDRAKRFYQDLGWRLDADFVRPDGSRAVQLTPPGSPTSILLTVGSETPERAASSACDQPSMVLAAFICRADTPVGDGTSTFRSSWREVTARCVVPPARGASPRSSAPPNSVHANAVAQHGSA